MSNVISQRPQATDAFVPGVRWAGTFVRGGRRTMRNALLRRCVTMFRQSALFRGDLDTVQHLVPWTHKSHDPNRHLDRFSRFCTAHPCARHRQTDTQTTLQATSSNRPHLCSACRRRGRMNDRVGFCVWYRDRSADHVTAKSIKNDARDANNGDCDRYRSPASGLLPEPRSAEFWEAKPGQAGRSP